MTRIVPRSEWGATVKTGPAQPDGCDEVWVHHSVTPLLADPFACMKQIEAVGKQRFGRFSYSYAYHAPTRLWLEGAGQTIGAHTGGRNTRAIGCVVIGNTDTFDPGPEFEEDLGWLIRNRIDAGHLVPAARAHVFPGGEWATPGYPTGGHRDQKSTACPGSHAYARLDAVRALVAGAANPNPAPPKGPLMALTDAEQADLLKTTEDNNRILKKLEADYLTSGKGVRQVIAAIDKRTSDLWKRAFDKPKG